MKALPIIALAIAIGIAGYEGTVWLGKTGLAPVIIALAIAIMFLAGYQLTREKV